MRRPLTPMQRVNADADAREQREARQAGPGSYAPCSRCGATVRWVARMDGSRFTVNVDPDPRGNIEILREVRGGRHLAIVHIGALTCPPQGHVRYFAHAGTCTNQKPRTDTEAP